MTEPVLRAAGPDDDEAIVACIAESFPHNPKADIDVLRWQYRRNPFGPTSSWVWDDGGDVVAHYSAFAMRALVGGRPVLLANAVDAAIAPSHQGRRLFTPLARALYDDCARIGMPVAVCFATNEIALRGVAKAGWRESARLRAMVAPFDDGWLARRFHAPIVAARAARKVAFPDWKGEAATEVPTPPAGLDDLWRQVSQPVAYGVVRDEAWWDWRYAGAPTAHGYRYLEVRDGDRLRGAAVVRGQERFGGRFTYFLELLADGDDAARALVAGARAVDADADGAVTLVVEGSVQHAMARRAGLRPLPRRLEPHPARFGAVDITGTHPGVHDGLWHLGWGDLDHV